MAKVYCTIYMFLYWCWPPQTTKCTMGKHVWQFSMGLFHHRVQFVEPCFTGAPQCLKNRGQSERAYCWWREKAKIALCNTSCFCFKMLYPASKVKPWLCKAVYSGDDCKPALSIQYHSKTSEASNVLTTLFNFSTFALCYWGVKRRLQFE